nr:MAG TPA: hypothetical protein [Bacteriophage sp.]
MSMTLRPGDCQARRNRRFWISPWLKWLCRV